MERINNAMLRLIVWIAMVLFIVFYPMLISIYVFLPLLIGVMGFILIEGIERGKIHYIIVSIIYFLNLEINLSLPFLLTIISSLSVYALFYKYLNYFRKCAICKPVIAVLIIDLSYLGLLLFNDFVMQTHSIVLDNILLYSLVVDLLVVVII
jgi:hypothetical protein